MTDPITDAQAQQLEGIKRRCFFNWLSAGRLRRLEDGSIDPSSLSMAAREKLLRQSLAAAAPGHPEIALQRDLFLRSAIAALKIPELQKPTVQARLDLVQRCINGNWRKLGYRRKRDFVYAEADAAKISGRQLERLIQRFKPTVSPDNRDGDPSVLCNRKPGPVERDPSAIEDWMALYLNNWYVNGKLTMRQCYEKLMDEREQRQAAWTVRDLYPAPTYSTVCRFLRRRNPIDQAARMGPDAVKTSLGYLDRRYDDIHSLGRIEVDEWITDALAYDPKNATRVGRSYLLTLFDARSLYPLTWALVEKSKSPDSDKKRLEQVEMDLFTDCLRLYGVPGQLHSDRGRFRGGVFGSGYFIPGSRPSEAAGALSGLGIKRNMPREHNPRGTRLERFHKELATFARTLPGWVGSDVKQRRMTPGDRQQAEHNLWVRGKAPATPLLSRDQLLEEIGEFMITWRERPSLGTDMNGLSPSRVFEDSKPVIDGKPGFRQVSEAEIAWHTARHFQDETIETGGIITLPDGKRYSNPELLLIQGQSREVVRLRDDPSFISVLPARKGETHIIASLRSRVGNAVGDSIDAKDALTRAHAEQGRVKKDVAAFLQSHIPQSSREPEVRSQKAIIPRASDAIPERDSFPAAIAALPEADLIETTAEEKPVPSLYEFDEPTLETL